MLQRRLISSAIVIAALLIVLWLDFRHGAKTGQSGLIAAPVLILVALLAGEELRRMLNRDGVALHSIYVGVAVLLSVGIACAPALWRQYPADCLIGKSGWLLLGIAASFGFIVLTEVMTYRADQKVLDRILRVSFISLYLAMLGFVVQLRFVGDNAWGMIMMMSLLLTAKFSDSFAYLVGRSYGRRKMSPVLSPGKTVEGGIAALVFGCVGTAIALYPLAWWLTGQVFSGSWYWVIIFGVVVTLAAMLGDLAESLLKRESQMKDSGSLIPGMGGVSDVIDSVIGAAPVAYFLWVSGLLVS